MFNDKWLNVFPLRSETRQECPLSPILLSIVLETLTRGFSQVKELKVFQIRKKEGKLPLFKNDMIYIQKLLINP